MKQRVLMIDDDAPVRTLMRRLLESRGYEVADLPGADDLEKVVGDFRPDVILCDILMPGRDGLAVCRAIKGSAATCAIPVVVISAKDYEGDQRTALEAGAASYLVKPFTPERLAAAVDEALATRVRIRIWGCRGSVPAPERALGQYGGNTPCVEITLPGHRHLVLDAGTGIRPLGNALLSESPFRTAILFSHYHWDHIQGLPFFKPLFVAGNEVTLYGPAENNEALTAKIAGEMGGDYFPVSIEAFRASVQFRAVGEEAFEVLGVPVTTLYAFHPSRTLAYRVGFGDRSVVYVPDNEILPEFVELGLMGEALRMAHFMAGASLVIHDCMYSDAQYQQRRRWGHSSSTPLAAVIAEARPERVLLFHHEPDNDDEQVEAVHRDFQAALAARGVEVWSQPAREGASVDL